MIPNCLTFDQLEAYSNLELSKEEHAHLYMHISTCELCACAVNGFTAMPFTSSDLVAIHREIDVKANATAVNPLMFARVIIVTLSLASIALVNFLCNSYREKNNYTEHLHYTKPISNHAKPKTQKISSEKIQAAEKAFYKRKKEVIPSVKRNTIEKLDMLGSSGILKNRMEVDFPELISSGLGENALYIYDLKVSDYDNLYFHHLPSDNITFGNHTPVNKENKESVSGEDAEISTIAADRILKDGLKDFRLNHFGSALESFIILIENNPEDVNAQFYTALSYYNIGENDKALQWFERVIKNNDKCFYQEAQWLSALTQLRMGENGKAKIILGNIVCEKGFYWKKASDMLKGL